MSHTIHKPLLALTAATLVMGLDMNAAEAQMLTTGGTAGTNENAGAHIGVGSHTGAGVNTNIAAGVGANTAAGASGADSAAGNANVTTTPGEMGATGSMHGDIHTSGQVAGATSVADIMPRGSGSYQFYKDVNVYFSPSTDMYYYNQGGKWYSSASAPTGVTLGKASTVRMTGRASVSGSAR